MDKTLKTCLLSIFLASTNAFAHGGGKSEGHQEAPKPKVQSMRRAASSPEALDATALGPLLNSPLPPDVAAIRCKLSEFTDCRGLTISLLDTHGHKVTSSNTGTEGMVAFEGLNTSETYVAKIESDRYAGQVNVTGGRISSILGERRTE